MNEQEKQKVIDDEHIRLLAMFHVFSAVMSFLFSGLMVIYFAIFAIAGLAGEGVQQTMNEQVQQEVLQDGGEQVARIFAGFNFFQLFFWGFGIFIALMVVYGLLELLAAKFFRQRTHKTFLLFINIIHCLTFPYGTVLGVFSIMVLQRNSVRAQFAEAQASG
jgi:bacteriorhodopsin